MNIHIAKAVQTRDHRRPKVSARKVMKMPQEAIFTIPYTPVAKRLLDSPVMPREVKIVGA
jgi:hypothetical protein